MRTKHRPVAEAEVVARATRALVQLDAIRAKSDTERTDDDVLAWMTRAEEAFDELAALCANGQRAIEERRMDAWGTKRPA